MEKTIHVTHTVNTVRATVPWLCLVAAESCYGSTTLLYKCVQLMSADCIVTLFPKELMSEAAVS